MLSSISVELALSVLLVMRVLKCFVTPTLTYTAQVDEGVLHISVLNFTGLLSVCVDRALLVLLVIGVLKYFITPTLRYTCHVDQSVLHIRYDFHHIIEHMR